MSTEPDSTTPPPAGTYTPMPPNPYMPVARPPVSPQRTVQVGLTVLSLLVLGIAVAVAFVALLEVVHIWFKYQWVPVARAVLALLVAGLAIYVLRMLVQGKLVRT